MIHKGKITRTEVDKAGIKLTQLASHLSVTRGTLYNYFENPNLSNDIIFKIGNYIKVDFTDKLMGFEQNAHVKDIHQTGDLPTDMHLIKQVVNTHSKELSMLRDELRKLRLKVERQQERLLDLEK